MRRRFKETKLSKSDPTPSVQPQVIPSEMGTMQLAAGVTAEHEAGKGAKLPKQLRSLFTLAPIVMLSSGIALSSTTYFPALQVEAWDPDNKALLLALITTISAIGAMVTQPLIGVLTDRTRTRFGSRKPWIAAGVALAIVALLTAGLAPNVAVLVIGILLLQVGFGIYGSPLSALLPDRVPVRFRGRYSSLMGVATIFGALIGPVIGSFFINQVFAGYLTFAGIFAVAVLIFLVVVPSHANKGEPRQPFSVNAFLTAFWVSPRKHPDFAWGFANRLLTFFALAIPSAYSIYIMQDYIGMPIEEAATVGPLIGLLSLPVILIVTAIVGPITDRIGRRKPTILIAGLLIVASAAVPAISPTLPALALSTILLASASGMFIVTDQALMSVILPDAENHGKDLGILNIGVTLPNVLAPAAAGLVVTVAGSYFWLYPFMALVGIIGALCVIPIKSTR